MWMGGNSCGRTSCSTTIWSPRPCGVPAIKTKRAVVEEALRTLIGPKRQEELLALRGKLPWEGDLDQMRRD
jgi:hypothetical protein